MEGAGHTRTLPYLLTLALILFGLFTAVSRIHDLVDALPWYLLIYAAAFGAYLLSLSIIRKAADTRRVLLLVLVSGFFFRIVLVPTWPTLSTDFYRYMWDGKVSNAGVNPYLHCPGSPTLEHLRDRKWHWINFRGTNTPYPPVSQMVFKLAYRFIPASPVPLKAIFLALDAATVFFILMLLKHFGLPLKRVVVYAWNPLVVIELYSSGHQDIIGTAFTWAAFFAAIVLARSALSGAFFAVSTVAKFYAAPLLPLFLRERWARFIGAFAVTAAAVYVPYMSAGEKVFQGFHDYASEWRVLGAVVPVSEKLFGMVTPYQSTSARALSAVVLLGIVIWVTAKKPEGIQILRSALVITAAMLLLVPTFYPWYLVYLVPFLCFYPVEGLILFTGTAVLYYLLPMFNFTGYILAFEYLPVFIALGIGRFKRILSA